MRFLVLALLLVAGCASGATVETATAVPDQCPDFSGVYVYPGMAGLAEICDTPWPEMGDFAHMPLPGEHGFYLSGREAHRFVIHQDECRSLTLEVFLGGYEIDQPKSITLSLEPEKKKQIVWGENSLFYKRKFTPSGARILPAPSFDRMEITLTREANGDLRYHLLHRATAHGRIVAEIECVWPKAGE